MLELSTPPLCVIRCCGPAAALDRSRQLELHPSGRIAPDEALLLVPPEGADRALSSLTDELDGTGAIVVDHTDAFAVISLSGEFRQALARLTAIEAPESGFFQGLVCDVPCKAMIAPDHLLLLAPSTFVSHVRRRLLCACADLGVRDLVVPAPQLEPVAS